MLFFTSSFDNKVEIDNGLEEDLIVQLDDDQPFGLPRGTSKLVRPSSGEHRIVARRADGGMVEDAKLNIGDPSRAERGFIGVYNVGRRSKYVIVKLDGSGRDAPDLASIERYSPTTPLFEMPTEVTSQVLNVPFLVNQAPNTKSLAGLGTVRMCTFDETSLRVGCPLCVGDYGTCGSSNHADERPFVLGEDAAVKMSSKIALGVFVVGVAAIAIDALMKDAAPGTIVIFALTEQGLSTWTIRTARR